MADAALVGEVRQFVEDRIIPAAHELDAKDLYATEIVKEISRRGWTVTTLPGEYGGSDRGYASALAICEDVGYGSAGVAISLITIFQAQTMLKLFGSEKVKKELLPRFAEGLVTSYALTEASHGSDIRSLDTKAVRDGDDWLLTGEKSFITSGSAAELFIILAETEAGVSVFAVPRDSAGLSSYEGEGSETFGLRNGPHVNIVLENVRVPGHYLIGTEGKGVRQAVTVLDYSRTLAAGISVGIARAAFDGAAEYALKRKAFDRHILQFQGIQWYFADMATEIDAARLLSYRAAEALDEHRDVMRYGSEAKLLASQVATRVASQAVQIGGAHGTRVNVPFGRYLRDAKTYEIGGGSSEILKNTLGKVIIKAYGDEA
ncbi:acyl-CoA dehydrogenase [Aquicoccus sp. SCR17]|nr:acyl-CoA dehydrogenase [Carideicomes alvinocaridis]